MYRMYAILIVMNIDNKQIKIMMNKEERKDEEPWMNRYI